MRFPVQDFSPPAAANAPARLPAHDNRAFSPSVERLADAPTRGVPATWVAAGGMCLLGVYVLRLLLLAVGISGTMYGYQLLLGSGDPAHPYAYYFPVRYFTYGAILLTAATLGRGRRELTMAATSLVCLCHLWYISPPLVPWMLVLIPTLYRLLGSRDVPGRAASWRFWGGVVVGVVVLPKCVQVGLLNNAHGSFLDANQNLFAGLFLRYAYYFYERRRGLVPAGGFWEHVAYLLFLPQITGMLNVPPAEMSARWGFGSATLRRGFEAVGWALVKIPAILWLERQVLPIWGYDRGYGALAAAPCWSVWACLLLSYVYWALLLSAKFDLMISLFRFYGLNVDDNFNWPLLATSPVSLWRRWNVYNRRLLLKFVYFPLGGSRDHVYRNILATFLASALLLHTGFLGSPWWGLSLTHLRDWLLYFTAQGVIVCVAYWWINRSFWLQLRPATRVSLAGVGWTFTLMTSALLHVLPLAAGNLLNNDAAPITGLDQRLFIMARALGWPG